MKNSKIGIYYRKRIHKNLGLYALMVVPIIYYIVFHYVPLYGARIAFMNYNIIKGFEGSEWVGFTQFTKFITSYQFEEVMLNTLSISVYSIVIGFPAPIILALALNYCKSQRYKKVIQMVTYAPHFVSTVVIAGIVIQLLNYRLGLVNNIIAFFGGDRISFIDTPAYFSSIYVWSDVWQQVGWGAIIYIAALAAVDPQLHEAAIVDGATKLQRIWNVDLPAIAPTVVIMLILRVGNIMTIGYEKVLLLQTTANIGSSEVVSTLVYKLGLASAMPNYSYSTAIGLFLALINFVLLVTVNQVAKKLNSTPLW